MISLENIRGKIKRKNHLSNKRLHFFSTLFSDYFSFIFINLNLSANQVTLIFFIFGLLSCFFFYFNNISYILLGYFLWRLHIIADICDGDVARFSKKFSINGAYWDYMVHSVIYPLNYSMILLSLYNHYESVIFLYLALIGSFLISINLSVKNVYSKALYNNSILPTTNTNKTMLNNSFNNSIFKHAFLNIFNYEGFLFFYVVLSIVNENKSVLTIYLIFYLIIFLFNSLIKFFSLSLYGFIPRRN